MPVTIPSTQSLKDLFLSNYEARLNQSVPLSLKAFLRVAAGIDALMGTSLFRYAAERILQNLALTATGDDLKRIGENYGIIQNPATACNLTITIAADVAATLPQTVEWVGDANDERYSADSSGAEAAGFITINITAKNTGESGNLEVSDALTIGTQTPGVSNIGTVTVVNTVGAPEETEASYRGRVLTAIRTVGGGGNSADYRTWSEEVTGVENAFPYAGKPRALILTATDIFFTAPDKIESTVTDLTSIEFAVGHGVTVTGSASNDGTYPVVSAAINQLVVSGSIAAEIAGASVTLENESLPGDRTVYVEAVSTLDPDGIASPALLAQVRSEINNDPETGRTRPPLGETDETLWVESIERTTLYVEVRSLSVDPAIEVTVKADIATAVDEYFRSTQPFITGLDFESDKNDIITDLTVSSVVQDILEPVGASAGTVGFGVTPGIFIPVYTLKKGEMAKSGGVTYI